MTAPNHALTGAAIGLTVANPWLALPLAFVSHLVLDLVPHYAPAVDEATLLKSKVFKLGLVGQAILCGVIVLLLAVTRPRSWILAAACAFVAASPDLFSIPRFRRAQAGKPLRASNWFARFHKDIQWFERPSGLPVEIIWLIAFSAFLLAHL